MWPEVRRGITADMALRLAQGTSAQMSNRGLTCKLTYDLRVAELAAGETINRVVKPRKAA